MDKYLIHYFSGTGNTYHMINTLKRHLERKGNQVDLLNVEKNIIAKADDYNVHIFCFPVYGFGTPAIMLRHMRSIKSAVGCKAVLLATSGGFEGQSLTHCKQLLKKRGFEVFYTDMVTYTYNWTQIINPRNKEVEKQVFKEAETYIEKITDRIINNENSFRKMNIWGLILSWAVFTIFSNFARKVFGGGFIADDNCVNCGKCKNVCPVKAITIENGKPKWNINCESCQRCINICPTKSIQFSVVKVANYAIFELAPIFILININNMHHFPIIINIIIYCIAFIINTILAYFLNTILEKIPLIRKIFLISYTKKYIRNIAEGFNPSSNNVD